MEKIDLHFVQFLVLLERQFYFIEKLISSQHYVLESFEVALAANEQSLSHVLDVYNYAFALTDHIERYRKIALGIPKFNKKSLEYRNFLSSLGEIKELRDQLQHINNDVDNDYSGPLLGAVCWSNGLSQYLASFNDIGRTRSSPGLVFDTQEGVYVQTFCYVYNEKYHDLQKAIEGIKNFQEYVRKSGKVQIDGKDYNINDHFAALCLRLEIPPVQSVEE